MMLKFDVTNRFTGAVQFTAEIDCEEGADFRVKLGLAVRWAIKTRADLRDANIAGVDLRGVDLRGANLVGANLMGADLRDANIAGANLMFANLAGANLGVANLTGAYLAGVNLAGAYLARANLARANLAGANLAGAYLAGAYLANAYLAGAKWSDGIVIQNAPIQIYGLNPYPVTILDQHMQIGCEFHSLAEWEAFDDRRILEMGGRKAAAFWAAHKDALLSMARAAGRSFEPVVAEAAE